MIMAQPDYLGVKISFNCSISFPFPPTLILLIFSAIFSTYSISFNFHNIALSSISFAVFSKLRCWQFLPSA